MTEFKLIVICGATATGKSGLALELATRLNTIIISADSRLVYREFDIGTAKPTPSELSMVPHYMIDICEPLDTMTVADYQDQVHNLIQTLKEATPLLVGGTGLYIKSIVQGMKIPRVAPNNNLRTQLLETFTQSQLYAMLLQVDSTAASKIHPNDPVRTIRALEVFYITGIPISEQQGENPPSYPILQIGLDSDPTHLTQRITQRTEKMIEDGFIAEVEYLSSKYGADLSLFNTLGYQEIRQYLAGEISLLKAKELTVLHTRQFAKRQRTWFHAYPEIEWFDIQSPLLLEQIWQRVQKFL
ncbi:tRNA dimethylallyltransferase [Dulcicalothrix desertica PCC 7102]|uniref:tRNA dimethylallyltransferase n=1 Tax=Dulcicalothrix desertica PCC 7102 TaxID=232991 RepID=A0A3S1CBV4_9CYAN|nr:tRNA (adenosine(37)-N6)-dimethylallyltransferase MiaA [Dulcicalothrix desertica]RUT00416.1 tRNA dimethylallyltransferase [Dulcicalothrix desertica PCC 7102]TWH42522.1 tRNA dimethylallyltransferase [Dulcicalothrix desertica PCC 7102]